MLKNYLLEKDLLCLVSKILVSMGLKRGGLIYICSISVEIVCDKLLFFKFISKFNILKKKTVKKFFHSFCKVVETFLDKNCVSIHIILF